MSRLDLTILPLVGGYIFLITFSYTANTHIRILPSLTGHREKTEGEVVSTGWIEIIEEASAAGQISTLDNPLGVITPVSEIIFISGFDHQIFGRFNSLEDKEAGRTVPGHKKNRR